MFALSRREASARALFPGDRPPIFFSPQSPAFKTKWKLRTLVAKAELIENDRGQVWNTSRIAISRYCIWLSSLNREELG